MKDLHKNKLSRLKNFLKFTIKDSKLSNSLNWEHELIKVAIYLLEYKVETNQSDKEIAELFDITEYKLRLIYECNCYDVRTLQKVLNKLGYAIVFSFKQTALINNKKSKLNPFINDLNTLIE